MLRTITHPRGHQVQNAPYRGLGVVWADLREDTMINPASGFRPIFCPPEPPGGSRSPGNGAIFRAGCTNNQTRRPILSPIRGCFVFMLRPITHYAGTQYRMLLSGRGAYTYIWVPEGSLAGSFGCVFDVWPAPGPGKAFKMWGRTPPLF